MVNWGSLKNQVRKAILSGGEQDFQKAHLLESVCNLQNLLGDSASRLTCLTDLPRREVGGVQSFPSLGQGWGERPLGRKEVWYVNSRLQHHQSKSLPYLREAWNVSCPATPKGGKKSTCGNF